jgi:hypothetical protein
MAGLLARGVASAVRLPGKASGIVDRTHRLQLRGQPRHKGLHPVPHSLFTLGIAASGTIRNRSNCGEGCWQAASRALPTSLGSRLFECALSTPVDDALQQAQSACRQTHRIFSLSDLAGSRPAYPMNNLRAQGVGLVSGRWTRRSDDTVTSARVSESKKRQAGAESKIGV